MKKKYFGIIVIAIVAILGLLNVNLNLKNSDLNLFTDNIEALAEIEQGQMANKCCPIWNVSYSVGGGNTWPQISCTTGGVYKCENCTCTKQY